MLKIGADANFSIHCILFWVFLTEVDKKMILFVCMDCDSQLFLKHDIR